MFFESLWDEYISDECVYDDFAIPDYVRERLRLITIINYVNKLDYLVSFLNCCVFEDFYNAMKSECAACCDKDSAHTCFDPAVISKILEQKLADGYVDTQMEYTVYYTLCKFFNLNPVYEDTLWDDAYFLLCDMFGVTPSLYE